MQMKANHPGWLSRTKPTYLFVLLLFLGIAFVTAPISTIVPAGVFAYLYMRSKCFSCLLSACIWVGYGILEYGMQTRTLCSGECNIRIDLIIAWAILAKYSSKAMNEHFTNHHPSRLN